MFSQQPSYYQEQTAYSSILKPSLGNNTRKGLSRRLRHRLRAALPIQANISRMTCHCKGLSLKLRDVSTETDHTSRKPKTKAMMIPWSPPLESSIAGRAHRRASRASPVSYLMWLGRDGGDSARWGWRSLGRWQSRRWGGKRDLWPMLQATISILEKSI